MAITITCDVCGPISRPEGYAAEDIERAKNLAIYHSSSGVAHVTRVMQDGKKTLVIKFKPESGNPKNHGPL